MKDKNEFMTSWKKYQESYFEGKIKNEKFIIIDAFMNFINNLLEDNTIKIQDVPIEIIEELNREA